MQKSPVTVIGKPYKGTPVGETIEVTRRDAKILIALGRVKEYVRPAAAYVPPPAPVEVPAEPAPEAPRPVRLTRNKIKGAE